MHTWRSNLGLTFAMLAALLGVVSCLPPYVPPEEAYKLGSGPYAVRQEVFTWDDASRRRELPIHVYAPDSEGPFPVIVFSHGLGLSGNNYTYLGEHWASHGYLVVFVTHPGTDNTAIYGNHWPIDAMQRAIGEPSHRWNRPMDVSFVLDQLEEDDSLRVMADMQRVAVAGHSFGAYTALATIGMRIELEDEPGAQFLDSRVKAVVAMSPPGPGTLGLTDQAWDLIGVPCMTMIGTLDWDLATDDPVTRQEPFTRSPGPDQYLVTLQSATHGVFDDKCTWLVDRLSYTQHHLYIQMATIAFLDAYINNAAEAQDWLSGGTFEHVTGGACQLECKHLTPIDDL